MEDKDKFKNQPISHVSSIPETKKSDLVISIADPKIPDAIDDIKSIESSKVASDNLKKYVIKNLLQPDFVENIKDSLEWRYKWEKISSFFNVIASIFALSTSVLNILSMNYSGNTFPILASISSVLVTFTLKFASDARSKGDAKTSEINSLLRSIGVDKIPELSPESLTPQENNNTVKQSTSIQNINKSN